MPDVALPLNIRPGLRNGIVLDRESVFNKRKNPL